MYAIVEIAGKQYKVREKDKLVVPRLNADVDEAITFDRVLLVANDDDVQLGTPVLSNATVTATVLEHVKGDKILVFRKKRRKRFKVKRGHRQPYTRIEVSGLSLDGAKKTKKSAAKKDDKAEAEAKTAKSAAPDAKAEKPSEAKASKSAAAEAKAEKPSEAKAAKPAEAKADKPVVDKSSEKATKAESAPKAEKQETKAEKPEGEKSSAKAAKADDEQVAKKGKAEAADAAEESNGEESEDKS